LAPAGTLTADKILETAVTNSHGVYATFTYGAGLTYTATVYAKAAERSWVYIGADTAAAEAVFFDLSGSGAVGSAGTGYTGTITPAGDGWFRCQVVFAQATALPPNYFVIGASTGNGTTNYAGNASNGILIWGAQLELGSTATPYQRVGTDYDVTQAGVPSMSYLQFNGINNSMATSTITPGIDKAQVFAGVRKNSDAAVGLAIELSVNSAVNSGAFYLAAPLATGASGDFAFYSRGSVAPVVAAQTSVYLAPVTTVLTGQTDISADQTLLRFNGAQVAQSTADQGTGNFGNYPLYIGARAGTSLFFNGQLYSLIDRFGPNLPSNTITSTEAWVAGKTGFYPPIITGVPTIGVS
jgi:hypothetical protein